MVKKANQTEKWNEIEGAKVVRAVNIGLPIAGISFSEHDGFKQFCGAETFCFGSGSEFLKVSAPAPTIAL
jgi:hypothetical protein